MMSSESKLRLYNRMCATRDELAPSEVERMSADIQHRIMGMEEYRTALRVGIYAAFHNEVRTKALYVEGERHRKEIYFPALDDESGRLSYFRVASVEDLAPRSEGFARSTFKMSRLREINDLGVLMVPGVAFDFSGKRMGLGRAFYDDNLKAFNGIRIALAYDFQVVPTLPAGPFERLIDWIVTERRVIRCQR